MKKRNYLVLITFALITPVELLRLIVIRGRRALFEAFEMWDEIVEDKYK